MYESGKNEIPVNLSKQTSDMTYSKTLYDNVMYKVSKEESPINLFYMKPEGNTKLSERNI